MVITYVIINQLEIENYLFDKKTKKERDGNLGREKESACQEQK